MTKKTITDNTVDKDVLSYTVGDDPILDLALAKWDCLGTAAHVLMLSEMKGLKEPIITQNEARKVCKELKRILKLIASGKFVIYESDQDVHMAVERMLTETLGDLGKKIHTGRSRNDQVAVDIRLHIKAELIGMIDEMLALIEALVNFGERNNLVPMVGRTHLQPAMPSSVGVWATGHAEMIIFQLINAKAAFSMNQHSPLGSAAGYGVPLPISRKLTAKLLGFESPIHNVFGASMGRGEDEACLISCCAQLMCVLSRLAEDMILFSMPEFGYFKLPREYCTGSSIMPQKFNPDVLELVRSKAAQVVGFNTSVLTLLHAMPGGYNRDLQDTKFLYMRALDITRTTLRILAKVVKGTSINEKKLIDGFTPGVFATDVALRKVADGIPWRDAYHEVRDHLEILNNEDPYLAVAAKTHAGTTGGLDYSKYRDIIASENKFVTEQSGKFKAAMNKLLAT